MKKYLKKLARNSFFISFARKSIEDLNQVLVNIFNTFSDINLDIGAGDIPPSLGWVNIDSLQGTVLSKDSVLEYEDESVNFIYSSHFFEHIDDEIALQLLLEGSRVLKKGKIFRIVVPNQDFFINLYKNKEFKKLSAEVPESIKRTWKKYNHHPENNELLLFTVIAAVSTNHMTTRFKHLVDLKNKPPIVLAPPAEHIKDFYGGPPPDVTSQEIISALENLSSHDFCFWVFNKCNNAEVDFDKYPFDHTNNWNPERFKKFIKENNLKFVVEERQVCDTNTNLLRRSKREILTSNSHRHTFSFFINLVKQ